MHHDPIPDDVASADTLPMVPPSSRSAGQRAAAAVKRNGYAVAGGGGASVIMGLTLLAQLLEHMGKINSAAGIQFGTFAVVAIVLLAIYLARQEQRDAEVQSERERTRNAYHAMIEAGRERDREERQDAHADLKSTIVTGLRAVESQIDSLRRHIEDTTGERRRIGSRL